MDKERGLKKSDEELLAEEDFAVAYDYFGGELQDFLDKGITVTEAANCARGELNKLPKPEWYKQYFNLLEMLADHEEDEIARIVRALSLYSQKGIIPDLDKNCHRMFKALRKNVDLSILSYRATQLRMIEVRKGSK